MTELQRHKIPGEHGTIEVEETSGVAFAEATGRVATPRKSRLVPEGGTAGQSSRAARALALIAAAGALAAALAVIMSRRKETADDGRHADERRHLATDAQDPPPQAGTATPLASPIPDEIPMTGEEDPLVEVDNPEFASVVAEFMRSERKKGGSEG